MTLDKITDYGLRAVQLLLGQFRRSPKIVALAEILSEQYQDLENDAHACITDRMLSVAEGVQLDQYGAIVGWPRLGFGDDDYRRLIAVAIAINTSDGGAETVSYVLQQLTGADTVWYRQLGPAHYTCTWALASDTAQAWLDVINAQMPKVVGSGVSWTLIEADSTEAFTLDVGPGLDEGKLARRVDESVGT